MALADNLLAFWNLEEASGTRDDAVGLNDLTDMNTVTQATGLIGYAGQFTASASEYLRRNDDDALDIRSGDFTLAAWVYLDSVTTLRSVFGKGALTSSADANRPGYWVYIDTARKPVVSFSDGSASRVTITASTAISALSTWAHVAVTFDRDANMTLYLNGSSVGSASISAQQGDCNSTHRFHLGASSSPSLYFDGRIDMAGVWSRALSSSEIGELYNGGSGRAYPFANAYIESGGVVAAWSAAGAGVAGLVDSGGGRLVGVGAGSSRLGVAESGAGAGVWRATGADARGSTETGGATGAWAGSGVGVVTFADSGGPVGAWRGSGFDVAGMTDGGGALGVWRPTGADAAYSLDAGGGRGVWVGGGLDVVALVESGAVVGVWRASGLDAYAAGTVTEVRRALAAIAGLFGWRWVGAPLGASSLPRLALAPLSGSEAARWAAAPLGATSGNVLTQAPVGSAGAPTPPGGAVGASSASRQAAAPVGSSSAPRQACPARSGGVAGSEGP